MREKLKPWQKAGMSPTRRTLAYLKEHGWKAAITEHWNAHAFIRQDLFGFIDVLAVHSERGQLLALQACAGGGGAHAERRQKILGIEIAHDLALHMDIAVISWQKRGARGEPKLYQPRIETLTKELLPKKSLLRRKLEEGTWEVA